MISFLVHVYEGGQASIFTAGAHPEFFTRGEGTDPEAVYIFIFDFKNSSS
jgi:hypothetical protein